MADARVYHIGRARSTIVAGTDYRHLRTPLSLQQPGYNRKNWRFLSSLGSQLGMYQQ